MLPASRTVRRLIAASAVDDSNLEHVPPRCRSRRARDRRGIDGEPLHIDQHRLYAPAGAIGKQGRIVIQGKVEFKKHGFSPDRFDAAIQTFFKDEPTREVIVKKEDWTRLNLVVSDSKPSEGQSPQSLWSM